MAVLENNIKVLIFSFYFFNNFSTHKLIHYEVQNVFVILLFRSKIAIQASSWLDDYFSWIGPSGQDSCCRMKYKRDPEHNKTVPVVPPTFCNATG